MDLFDHASYPERPGARRRDTSVQAARETMPRVELLRDRVLECVRRFGPLTADEVADRLNESPLSIRPRVTELGKKRLIADSGTRRRNVTGKTAIAWRAQ